VHAAVGRVNGGALRTRVTIHTLYHDMRRRTRGVRAAVSPAAAYLLPVGIPAELSPARVPSSLPALLCGMRLLASNQHTDARASHAAYARIAGADATSIRLLPIRADTRLAR